MAMSMPLHGARPGSGRLYVVATPIGNLEDITLRALRILGEVPIIAAEDTRSARHLLNHHRIGAARPEPPQILSFFAGNEASRTSQLLSLLREGNDVALISEAGLPGISDPGQRLVVAARKAAVPVEVVPGACAAVTALVGSGLPSERFLFIGFLPRRDGQKQPLLAGLSREPGTLIFYEAPDRVADTLQAMVGAFGGARPACVARELTKLYEEYASGTLAELSQRYAECAPRGEVTILVSGFDATSAVATADAAVAIEDAVRARLVAGQGPREIAAALVLSSGYPRRQIYQLALALTRSASDLPAR
jgi:16S rRNA (cytidine1402-2'-O)-methyltransferase